MNNIIDIPVQVSSYSCIGTSAIFPRGCGNYMTTYNTGSGHCYKIVNLSYEDLQDLIDQNYITNTMKAIVYPLKHNGQYMAYVIDDRIPKECLTPFWLYGIENSVVTKFVREYHKVPTETCICNHDHSKKMALRTSMISRTARHQECRECDTKYVIYTAGWHDADVNPDYFDGIKEFRAVLSNGQEQIINGQFRYNDYRRHNSDGFAWQQLGDNTLIKWKYMEQED